MSKNSDPSSSVIKPWMNTVGCNLSHMAVGLMIRRKYAVSIKSKAIAKNRKALRLPLLHLNSSEASASVIMRQNLLVVDPLLSQIVSSPLAHS